MHVGDGWVGCELVVKWLTREIVSCEVTVTMNDQKMYLLPKKGTEYSEMNLFGLQGERNCTILYGICLFLQKMANLEKCAVDLTKIKRA